MPQRFAIAVPAPEHAADLAGWIGAEPTGEAEEEEGGWFDWLPGIATGITDFVKSEGGQEVIKAGVTLYTTREQREAAEAAAKAKQDQSTLQQWLKIGQSRPTIPTSPTLPSQPTVIMQPTGGKTNWVLPVAIGVGALVLLGGGFFLLKGKTKTRRRR